MPGEASCARRSADLRRVSCRRDPAVPASRDARHRVASQRTCCKDGWRMAIAPALCGGSTRLLRAFLILVCTAQLAICWADMRPAMPFSTRLPTIDERAVYLRSVSTGGRGAKSVWPWKRAAAGAMLKGAGTIADLQGARCLAAVAAGRRHAGCRHAHRLAGIHPGVPGIHVGSVFAGNGRRCRPRSRLGASGFVSPGAYRGFA